MTTISLIAAMDKNRLIGNGNDLPWHISADLQHFKRMTLGKPIVMGRLTYESIGRALPGRKNIVITRNPDYHVEDDLMLVHSLDEACKAAGSTDEIMVIGGAQLFKECVNIAQRMVLTLIDHEFEGDIYFPEWNVAEWRETARADIPADDDNPYPMSFVTLERAS